MIRSLIWSMLLICLAASVQADAGVKILAPAAGQPLFGVVTLTAVVTACGVRPSSAGCGSSRCR